MNKFIKFNSILFSLGIFLLNPIVGMNKNPSTKSFPHWTTGTDDYSDDNNNSNNNFSDSEKSELENDRSYYNDHAAESDSSDSDGKSSSNSDDKSSSDSDSRTSVSEFVDNVTMHQTEITLNDTPHPLALSSPRTYSPRVKTSDLATSGQRILEKSLEKIGQSIESGNMRTIKKLKNFIRTNDQEVVTEILNKRFGTEKFTLLHYVILFLENPEIINDLVDLFIRHGANPNTKDAYGKSALSYALTLAEDLNKKTNKTVTILKKHIKEASTRLDKKD